MNKKSYLSRVRLPRTPAEWLEAVMNFIFFLCGMLAVGCVVLISVYMVISGVPAIHKIGLFQFLFGTKWHILILRRSKELSLTKIHYQISINI